MSSRKRLLVAGFFGHFFLIFCVCARGTLSIVAPSYSSFSPRINAVFEKAENPLSSVLGERLSRSNPARQILNLYLHATGIEVGYGYFRPNVPDVSKIVFELHYANGKVEYELPTAAALRLTTLIDTIGDTQYDPLREVLVKMMAYAIWRTSGSDRIRAVLGFVILPSPDDFRQGLKESYQATHAYDFALPVRDETISASAC